jgi:hypothetical protein
MLASPSGTRVHTESLEMGVQQLCHATSCGFGDLLVQVVALAWLVALALLAVAALSYVRDATDAVSEEIRRTSAEIEALKRFRRRITGLEASAPAQQVGPGPGGGAVGLGVSNTRPPDDRLERVRTAYEETVMDVPHFEEDYGESLRTHLAAEFGEEVAHAVVDGRGFTPQLQQVLLRVTDEGESRREDLLVALERERDRLGEYGESLGALESAGDEVIERPLYQRSFGDLYDAWHEFERLETEADHLLAERQETIHHDRTGPAIDRDRQSFHAYLYGDLEVDYPVLAAGGEVLRRLRSARRDVLTALTRRV